jgi:hypothetical protein
MKEIAYSFNQLEIVGASGRDIFVKSLITIQDGTEEYGVKFEWACLVFSMTKWTVLQKAWVVRKKELCELYGHFCGTGSVVSYCDYVGEIDLRIDPDFNDPNFDVDTHDFSADLKMFTMYRPNYFGIDMEHG